MKVFFTLKFWVKSKDLLVLFCNQMPNYVTPKRCIKKIKQKKDKKANGKPTSDHNHSSDSNNNNNCGCRILEFSGR